MEKIQTTSPFFKNNPPLMGGSNYVSLMQLNDDLIKISNWAYQWKMSFNPEVTKQAQEVVFSIKSQKVTHPTIYFNNPPVIRSSCLELLEAFI